LNPTFCSKAVCVARNWRAHIKELGNVEPEEPVFFIKPTTAICPLSEPIVLPKWSGEVHHEIELALLVDTPLKDATLEQAAAAVSHVALALDLTARDVQARLKQAGLPWEKSKAFDGSLPLGRWIPVQEVGDLGELELKLLVNGAVAQCGKISQMIHSPIDLLVEASRYFTLSAGDILLTGTPAGVGPLAPGDQLELFLSGQWAETTEVYHGC